MLSSPVPGRSLSVILPVSASFGDLKEIGDLALYCARMNYSGVFAFTNRDYTLFTASFIGVFVGWSQPLSSS